MENFTSTLTIDWNKKIAILNALALESMDLDVDDSYCMIVSPKKTEEKNTNQAIYIININKSDILLEINNADSYIHEIISKDSILPVHLEKNDDEISGYVKLSDRALEVIEKLFGKTTEFKIIPQETVRTQLKEFKDNFSIVGCYHKIVKKSFKNNVIGKISGVAEIEETIKIKN